MHIIVVRHAERSRTGEDDPLTEAGRAAAEATGHWLRDQPITLGAALSTQATRTRQTAQGVLAGLGRSELPVVDRASMPRDVDGWDKLVDELRDRTSSDVLLVVHHPTQRLVERAFGGDAFGVPPGNRAAAFVLAKDASGWRCVAAWPGAPSAV